jgi:hypothetical protein
MKGIYNSDARGKKFMIMFFSLIIMASFVFNDAVQAESFSGKTPNNLNVNAGNLSDITHPAASEFPASAYKTSFNFRGQYYYSIFHYMVPPDALNFLDDGEAPVELGMKFRSSEDAFIAGFCYYKGFEAKGEHIGNLWTINGINLARAIFTNESDSGWQIVLLDDPVEISADSIYVVSYFSPHGDYVKTVPYFTTDIVNGPLTALAWTEDQPNGVYAYSDTSTFPNSNEFAGSTNYWIDVIMFLNTTDINNSSSNADAHFLVFPNPASGQFSVAFNFLFRGIVRVVDIQGKEMLRKTLHAQLSTVDCSTLTDGIYYVLVSDDNTGLFMTRKLVVRK